MERSSIVLAGLFGVTLANLGCDSPNTFPGWEHTAPTSWVVSPSQLTLTVGDIANIWVALLDEARDTIPVTYSGAVWFTACGQPESPGCYEAGSFVDGKLRATVNTQPGWRIAIDTLATYRGMIRVEVEALDVLTLPLPDSAAIRLQWGDWECSHTANSWPYNCRWRDTFAPRRVPIQVQPAR